MFPDWVTPGDFERLRIKLAQGQWRNLARKLFLGSRRRVVQSWSHCGGERKSWYDVPAIQRRWNALIAGDPAIDFQSHVCGKFLAGRSSLRGLSIGCGTGAREILWARTGRFERLDAIDLSPARISFANERAVQEKLDGVLRFEVGDALSLNKPEGSYDVVFGEQSLHHLTPLADVFAMTERLLKPGGLLVVNEFVGPIRFQWTDRQIELSNALLRKFPEERRVFWNTRIVKRRVVRPGRLTMYLSDPSEAVESSRILPLARERFEVLEERGYGGTLLQLVFADIAHHFLDESRETLDLLDLAFKEEDFYLGRGDIQSDFATLIGRRRS
ncbi:MAG: class I SAM-dependent methyltransferase [Verrucomicrobiae bacterium]|nr:class I SAM-dependent methyltransferase [Verrucomicrobiae bacterium]